MKSGTAVSYSPALDGIRALAALVVVVYHARMSGLTGGFFGVDVFFVLSGYLITRLLIAEHERSGRVRLGRFISRRLRRLLPALLLMLAVYLLVSPWVFPNLAPGKHLRDALLTVLYVVNYASFLGGAVSVLGHVWTLAVEMHFYLLWPLVLLGLLRLPRGLAIACIALLYVLATAWRWWGAENLTHLWAFYVRTDTHCSGLLLGYLLGYLNMTIHRHWAWLGLLILAFAMTFFSTVWLPTARYGFSIAELGAALLLLAQPAWLGGTLLAWLGRMSYGLYLWHYPVIRAMRDWVGTDQWLLVLAVGGALGLLGAVLSYYLVERRFYRPGFARRERPRPKQLKVPNSG